MNSQRHIELILGLFMLAGIVAITFLSVRLGNIDVFTSDEYQLIAKFTSASGLKPGASVEIAGVRVGHIQSITFDSNDYLAVVNLALNNEVKVPDDTIASIRTAGIIGDKFLKLSAGGSDIYLENGEEILETEPSINLEELISKYIFESDS